MLGGDALTPCLQQRPLSIHLPCASVARGQSRCRSCCWRCCHRLSPPLALRAGGDERALVRALAELPPLPLCFCSFHQVPLSSIPGTEGGQRH